MGWQSLVWARPSSIQSVIAFIVVVSNLYSETFGLIYVIMGFVQLESYLHPLALSADWLKHVDSDVTMGSASHIVTASLRASAKNGIGRKRGRPSELESNPSSNSASGLGMFWWRGGRLSRQLFNWKVLPCSLVSKAARQGLQFSSSLFSLVGSAHLYVSQLSNYSEFV